LFSINLCQQCMTFSTGGSIADIYYRSQYGYQAGAHLAQLYLVI
jgi:hypothetical protein